MTSSDINRILGALQAESESACKSRAAIHAKLDAVAATAHRLDAIMPGVQALLADHGKRLRAVESEASRRVGRSGIVGALSGLAAAGIAAVVTWFTKGA